MIPVPSGVRVWLATGHTDMRKGFPGLAVLVQETLKRDPFDGNLFIFAGVAANQRHSAYSLRFATIAYRWHPLFGRTLQVSPFRRGKALTCIYTHERPDLCRELPNWMFDKRYCIGMALGPPEISIEGLNELAGVLAAFGTNRKRSAQSRPSNKKEKSGAEKPVSRSRAARSRAGTQKLSGPGGAEHERIGRDLSRSSSGGSGNGRGDIDEQGGRR